MAGSSSPNLFHYWLGGVTIPNWAGLAIACMTAYPIELILEILSER